MTKIDIVRSWIRWVLWWMCHVQICRIVYNDWHMRYTSWPTKAWEECNMIYYASDCVFSWYFDMHLIYSFVIFSIHSWKTKLSIELIHRKHGMFINAEWACWPTKYGKPASAKTDAWYQHKSGTQMKQFIFWRSSEFYCKLFYFLKVNGVLLQMKALPSGKIT